jgi:hypothetical protein
MIKEATVSDGEEERREQEKVREREKRENHEDRLDRYPEDEWKPERQES